MSTPQSETKTIAVATHKGVLPLGDGIKCYVLNDGRRVVNGRNMTKSIGLERESVRGFAGRAYLRPYMDDVLARAIDSPVAFVVVPKSRAIMHGYDADVLHRLCEALLRARQDNLLVTDQAKDWATKAEILLRGFARVGLIALIDEVTGYQADRRRDELQDILRMFVGEELCRWARTFPASFYKHLFRLLEWEYDPNSTKRPKYAGKFTHDYVYKQLPEPVLEELKRLNPIDARGRRRRRHHQWLSREIGHPVLERQVVKVLTLMKASGDMDEFKRLYTRSHSNDSEEPEGSSHM
jgi:hypothetical protein